MKMVTAANSAEIVASIDHLLATILLLLPIKSLLRFKSVSKDWLALISNPLFCHLRNPNPNPAVGLFLSLPGDLRCFEYIPLFAHKTPDPPVRKFQFNKEFCGFRILQSCNGLLLCSSIHDHELDRRYCVYNPTTNCRFELPKPAAGTGNFSEIRGMNLAFDPVKSRHYNVVCIRLLEVRHANFQHLIEIYSSEEASWRSCGEHFEALVNFENGVFWNGAIHWLGIGNGESLYFNIAHQAFGKMPMLPLRYGWNSRTDYYFSESCDHLHFIEMRGPAIQFNVYEMRRDYSEWFVKYQVDLSRVAIATPMMVYGYINPLGWYSLVFSVFMIIEGEQEEDSFLVLQVPGKVIRYNLVSKAYEDIYEFEGNVVQGSLRYPSITAFQYIESLCCV